MHSANVKTSAAYRPDIDGLRAVAILGVVAYHVGLPVVSGGFTGVDVFFVISGFLITQLLARQIAKTGRLSLAEFYARRMRRLLPALAVVILATLLVGAFLVPPTGERNQLAQSALSALGFFANQFFLANTFGYFDGPSELKPLLHLWSLSVEEQFYIVWPLALIAVTRLTSPERRVRWFRITIVAITVLSFALSVRLVRTNMSAAFFISPARAWELGIGALLSLWTPQPRRWSRAVGHAASWAGAALIGAAYMLIEPSTGFPGMAALLPVLGSALLIYGNSLDASSIPARVLTTKPMVWIGVLSYAWYLWHWPLIAFARIHRMMAPDVIMDSGCVVLALVLAALTLRFVENPVRYGPMLQGKSNGTVIRAGAMAIGSLAVAALGLLAWDSYGLKTPADRLAIEVAHDRPAPAYEQCLFDRYKPLRQVSVDQCRFGDPKQPISLALWGDSHAMAWAPMLGALQTKGAPAFKLYSLASCQPLLARMNDNSGHDFCDQYNRQTIDEIVRLKPQGLTGVVLAGRWVVVRHRSISRYDVAPEHPGLRDYIRQIRARRNPSNAAATDVLESGLESTIDRLTKAGLRVLILIDPPETEQPIPACVFVHFPAVDNCGISRDKDDAYTLDVRSTISSISERFPSSRAIDPTDNFCGPKDCLPFFEDRPTLFDDDHISTSVAEKFASRLRLDFDWLLRNQ